MIQLNLLPEVKQQFIKAQKERRLVVSISLIVSAAAVVILVLILGVDLAQKKHLSDLNKDITNETAQLKGEPQISQILTVQNQLESLTTLHAQKPAVSRLFNTYLNDVTPASISISDITADFTQQSMTITGNTDSLATVDQYVDTLKFTTYTTSSNSTPANAFKNVVLSGFSVSGGQDPSQAESYTITLSYDPVIFDITQNVTLSVPNKITTRSELAVPTDLFRSVPNASQSGGSNGQ